MPRDKFAAMASRAKITTNASASPETGAGESSGAEPTAPASTSPAPKRDKLAALAARSGNPGNQTEQKASDLGSTTTTPTASPPKRDKMAALAARSSQSPVRTDSGDTTSQAGSPNRSLTPPPKRDKMAALAARSRTPPSEPDKTKEAAPTDPQQKNGSPAALPSITPRRNKLAALAARSANSPSTTTTTTASAPAQAEPSRNNKLAKLAGASQSSTANDSSTTAKSKTEEEMAAEAAKARAEHLAKLRERLSKRKGILDSLDRAEELTCKLLKIAAKTTDALQDLNFSPHLSQLSVAYRSTLQELHPLLTAGTEELIKPYQNHTKETKQSMYAARVEMRLAKERLEVLKTFSALEKEENTIDDNHTAVASDESDRKRKR